MRSKNVGTFEFPAKIIHDLISRKWCGVRRSTWLLLFYVGIYVAYLVIGAWAMWFFEINNENMLRKGTHL